VLKQRCASGTQTSFRPDSLQRERTYTCEPDEVVSYAGSSHSGQNRHLASPRYWGSFHEFSSDGSRPSDPSCASAPPTTTKWALSAHLLPHFARFRLSEITVEVDRYKRAKAREGALSPGVIDKTLTRLAQILEDAVEYGRLRAGLVASAGVKHGRELPALVLLSGRDRRAAGAIRVAPHPRPGRPLAEGSPLDIA
jgi:hypothetical protein